MKIFKFGGASVKNAEGVSNLVKILRGTDCNDTIIVVSAMGKTTNSLEKVVDLYLKNSDKLNEYLYEIENFHQMLMKL